MPVEMHAEALPADPTGVRWVLPGGLGGTGRVLAAPGRLGELLAAGVLVRAMAEPGALWTWLATPDWATQGAEVRDALADALEAGDGWCFKPAPDELLELVARDVIERSLGAYIASHGGQISLLRAAEGVVEVRLDGTCAHCPAAGLTLHERIERAIRGRLGDAIEVRAEGDCADNGGRPGWWPRRPQRGG